MDKLEIQKLVTKNGKLLDLDKFEWCEKTNTFTSNETGLDIDVSNCDDSVLITFDGLRYCRFLCNQVTLHKFENVYHCRFVNCKAAINLI